MAEHAAHPSGSDDHEITAAYDHAPAVLPEHIASVVQQALRPPFNYDLRRQLAHEVLSLRGRDGRLLAAAQGIDLDAGHIDNPTREYWHNRGDEARTALRAMSEGAGRG